MRRASEIPDDPRFHDYEELLAAAEPVEFHVEDENQAAAMCYTSGTTGHPKGVVYSHRSTWLHSIGVLTNAGHRPGPRPTQVMPVVPMFHANAWGLAHAAPMAGASLVFPGPDMSPQGILKLLRKQEVTLAGRSADDLAGAAAVAGRRGVAASCDGSPAAVPPYRWLCRRLSGRSWASRSCRPGG